VLAKKLCKEDIIALDIEADSLHHYSPKVCLIQISTRRDTFIIDPLAIETIDPLRSLLVDRKIKKVLHGGDYDLRSLHRDFAITVPNIFDTMVASQFLGEAEVGLAAVLKTRFGLILDKKYQRADWSKRPLTKDMLQYAARDTDHLIKLYEQLTHELDLKGRLDWVEEECSILSAECATANNMHGACDPRVGNTGCIDKKKRLQREPRFKRFKGAGTMSPRDLAVLEKLLAYRDKRAKKQDRPPFKLFGNKLIKDLVKTKPTGPEALETMPGLPKAFMKRYAKGVLSAIKTSLALPENRLPVYPRKQRPVRNPKKRARLSRLKTWRDGKAEELALNSGILCSNALLEAVAERHPKDLRALEAVPGMRKWQVRILGKEIIVSLRTP
jgi:ribonuclease D